MEHQKLWIRWRRIRHLIFFSVLRYHDSRGGDALAQLNAVLQNIDSRFICKRLCMQAHNPTMLVPDYLNISQFSIQKLDKIITSRMLKYLSCKVIV
jgi:hypothetical protein